MTSTQSESTPILGNTMSRIETAKALGITPRSLDRWAWQRKGPPRFKIGVKAYYDRADVEAFLQNLKHKAAEGWGDT